MAPPTYDEVLKLAEGLTPDERLRLIAALAAGTRSEDSASDAHPGWLDLLGTAPSPALGEEAQAWVTRTREEWNQRERRLRERP